MTTTAHTLTLSTGTSRGRETYGYTIVRLHDSATGKTYRCMGGGYDMVGTVLGDWLQDVHQLALRALTGRAWYRSGDVRGYVATDTPDALYGLFHDTCGGAMRVDGACGVSSVLAIAEAAGVELQALPATRRGRAQGWIVV